MLGHSGHFFRNYVVPVTLIRDLRASSCGPQCEKVSLSIMTADKEGTDQPTQQQKVAALMSVNV